MFMPVLVLMFMLMPVLLLVLAPVLVLVHSFLFVRMVMRMLASVRVIVSMRDCCGPAIDDDSGRAQPIANWEPIDGYRANEVDGIAFSGRPTFDRVCARGVVTMPWHRIEGVHGYAIVRCPSLQWCPHCCAACVPVANVLVLQCAIRPGAAGYVLRTPWQTAGQRQWQVRSTSVAWSLTARGSDAVTYCKW